ncbi:MAG: thiamine pyrophosphate-dependent enzyme [Bacillota bacterium]
MKFARPETLIDIKTHYCPGCTHGIIHRLVAKNLDELGLAKDTIGIASVGCSAFTYKYFDIDMQQAAHGRAPAVATGVKRVHPDKFVFTYQGDGDLAAIGTAEIIHLAARGENITVIFVNNGIYGMTGGQMAPTTLLEQKTTTTPLGRDPQKAGYPLKMSELLANIEGSAYVVRASVHNPKNVLQADKAIKKAFQTQLDGKGFSIVEILSTCPTNWKMSPVQATKWLEQNMIPHFPLGEFKVKEVTK